MDLSEPKHAIMYYVSGTGNSFRLACLAGHEFQKHGFQITIKSTRTADPVHEIPVGAEHFLVLAFPAHGFTLPWEMLKFLWRIPRRKSMRAACLASRGSLKAGQIIVPGMSGSGTFVSALFLWLKGFRVRGVLSQNMPSNWCTVHPIQKRPQHHTIIEKANKRVSRFIRNIIETRREWFTLNNLYEFLFGLLLLPISVAYLYIGRFFHGKLFFANKNCNACEVCAKNCPFGAIRLFGKKKPLPYWTYRCESCMRCATICPKNAIEIGQSWGVILFYLWTIPFAFYIMDFLGEYFSSINQIRGTILSEIINVLFWYPSILIPYIIFQLSLRIPFIHWLFTHTTMTHFNWWGRYSEPDTNIKEL
jgi:ferredoxin